jgi:hypothetical protein
MDNHQGRSQTVLTGAGQVATDLEGVLGQPLGRLMALAATIRATANTRPRGRE